MSFWDTKKYLDQKYPTSLYLTKKQCDIETQGKSNLIENVGGLYLISDVAKFICPRPKRSRREVIEIYNSKINEIFGVTMQQGTKSATDNLMEEAKTIT